MNPLKIIKKFDLKLSSEREMSLLTVSCVALAYTKITKNYAGFCFSSVGGVGFGGRVATFLYSEDECKFKTGKFLERHTRDEIAAINRVLKQADKLFFKSTKQLQKSVDWIRKNPDNFLSLVSKYYPIYLTSLNLYNNFWRYIGNDFNRFPPNLMSTLSKNRTLVAEFYPLVEKMIAIAADVIGRQKKWSKAVIPYSTLVELNRYLRTGKITKKEIADRVARRRAFLYISWGGFKKVFITHKKEVGKKALAYLSKIPHKPNDVKGFCAQPGNARGRVYRLPSVKPYPKDKFIIIANSTHQRYISIIKKSQAIVADEGGVLSHAAVIARELKKPCIIGTKIATKVFKDGDMVEVDAEKGIVRKM